MPEDRKPAASLSEDAVEIPDGSTAPPPGAPEAAGTEAPPGSVRDGSPEAPTEPGNEPAPEQVQEELRDQLQRVSAEFANYRRRTMRERAEWETRAKADLASRLVPVLDDIERARAHLDPEALSKETEGLWLVCARLEEILRSAGLETQATAPGVAFDPEFHEAIISAHSDEHPDGAIVETIQPGYLFQGMLLRPARVRVSRGPAVDQA